MKKRLLPFAAMAAILASCSSENVLETNPDPTGQALSFSIAVGHTRATEINIGNLGNFAVIGRGMHHDGVLYESFLIGNKQGGEIAKFKQLSSEGNGIWELGRKVYWPTSLKEVLFIGYTTLTRDNSDNSGNSEDSTNDVLSGASFITSTDGKPTISNVQPVKVGLTDTEADNGIWADGKNQKDLLVAFQAQKQSANTTIPLTFRHALTQVSIKAQRKNMAKDDHRIVYVKGAWIVNAAKTGELTATIGITNSDTEGKIVSNKTTWTATGNETYGAYYNDAITLRGNELDDLLRQHSLMLIPQSLKAWDKTETNTTGAYIMLLCRIELEHEGTTHDDKTDIKDIGIDGTKHYHQLFPVNAAQYNGAEYGFVCVPIPTDWGDAVANQDDCKGMGKHYTYNLDICGSTTGAGIYPPISQEDESATKFINKLIPTGATVSALVWDETDKEYKRQTTSLSVVTKRPAGKNAGAPVLDEEIKFSVSVNGWENGGTWTNGSETQTTEE